MEHAYRSSLEMSTPTVPTGLSMLDFITDAKFFRMSFMAAQPVLMYLKSTIDQSWHPEIATKRRVIWQLTSHIYFGEGRRLRAKGPCTGPDSKSKALGK